MKTHCLFILLIAFTILPGCEKEDSGKNKIKGWFLAGSYPGSYRIGIEDQDHQNGLQCAFIESVADTASGFGTLMQYCKSDSFVGKRVRMTGYVQSLAPQTTNIQMWMRVDDYDNDVTTDFDNMGERPLRGTNTWTKCDIVFDVPESQCIINYGLILAGPGTAWFDHVSFDTVTITTPKTAYETNYPFPEDWTYPENYPSAPVNLDFEE